MSQNLFKILWIKNCYEKIKTLSYTLKSKFLLLNPSQKYSNRNYCKVCHTPTSIQYTPRLIMKGKNIQLNSGTQMLNLGNQIGIKYWKLLEIFSKWLSKLKQLFTYLVFKEKRNSMLNFNPTKKVMKNVLLIPVAINKLP